MKARILVIEDNHVACDTYAAALRQQEHDVDCVYTYDQAMDALSKRTYHVAIVDIMLEGEDDPERPENTDGMKILDEIRSAKEGTIPIVLSALKNTDLVAQTLQDHGAKRFISKKSTIGEGPVPLREEVSAALEDVQLAMYGAQSDILSFLARGEDGQIWISRCIRALKPSGGEQGFRMFVESLLIPFAPLLLIRDAADPLELPLNSSVVRGRLWSKSRGAGIQVLITNEQQDEEAAAKEIGLEYPFENVLKSNRKARLVGIVIEDPHVGREQFRSLY